ncbi:MAG: ankyrin repeat domain-containing protein [Nitrospiraceae bacterium]|nr:ankyrin repeat domain-containing protein [Nitrospiraceae bacterium]
MRYKNLFLSIGIMAMMSGCAAYVRTPDIVLDYQPPKDVAIGLSMADVDVSKAVPTSDYNNYANDIFSTLLNESKGSITRYDNQLFRLKVSLQIAPTNIEANALIGVPSLFIPPMAFIPESSTDTYRVTYAIQDRYENIILAQDMSGTVEGALQGYFVGRINAGLRVGSVKAAYAAKNAARLVLRDMNTGRNAETLVLAAKRLDNIDYKDENGETALMLAAKAGRAELAGRLLDKGAAVNAVSTAGDTALHLAAGSDHADVVALLLDKGAKVNAVNTAGSTALILAAGSGYADVVSLLLARGADAEKQGTFNDKTGTPLEAALQSGSTSVVSLFMKREENLDRAAAKHAGGPGAAVDGLSAEQATALRNAYAEFLRKNPSSSLRRDILAAMSGLIRKQKGTYADYEQCAAEFADVVEFVPTEYRLDLIGPAGMRIHDIHGLLEQGTADKVIAAKIRMRDCAYKDFDAEELGKLKQMGVTDLLIEAMLDSTARAKRDQDDLQKKNEMEDLMTEIQHMRKKIDELKAAQIEQQSQAPSATAASRESGPSLSDAVKNCAAQLAALEACKQLSGLAEILCRSVAKSQFPCEGM